MTASPRLMGLGAGLVSAVLFASLATNSLLAVALFYLTPLPTVLAGFGWGVRAAQLALIVAGAVIALALNVGAALMYGLYIGLPAVILCHLTVLSRTVPAASDDAVFTPHPVTEWYPIGRVVAWAALMAGALTALAILFIGGDAEGYKTTIRAAIQGSDLKRVLAAALDLEPDGVERFTELLAAVFLPAFSAVAWLIIMLLNLWLAAKVAAISGLMKRPWPPLMQLDYPRPLALALVLALAATLAPGLPGIMAMGFVGALTCAFGLLGLAVLHVVTMGLAVRPLLLGAAYVSIVFITWAAIAVAALGVAETVLSLRARALHRQAQSNIPSDRD